MTHSVADDVSSGSPADLADLSVGSAVTPFVRAAGLAAWNRFAAVNHEFVDIHMDDEAGQAAGYPGAIGMGNLIWSWLHLAVEQWVAGRGRLEHIECRFTEPALKGDEITCSGAVTDRRAGDDGATVLHLDLWAERQDGTRLVKGQARVVLTDGT
jgi:acyl dehydratase